LFRDCENLKVFCDDIKLKKSDTKKLLFIRNNQKSFWEFINIGDIEILKLKSDNQEWENLIGVISAEAKAHDSYNDEMWNEFITKCGELHYKYVLDDNMSGWRNIKGNINGALIMEHKKIKQGKLIGLYIEKTIKWIVENDIKLTDDDSIRKYIISL
jgi:hypothetical protein